MIRASIYMGPDEIKQYGANAEDCGRNDPDG